MIKLKKLLFEKTVRLSTMKDANFEPGRFVQLMGKKGMVKLDKKSVHSLAKIVRQLSGKHGMGWSFTMGEVKLTEKFNLNKRYIDDVRVQLKKVRKLSPKEIKAYKKVLINKLDKKQLQTLSKAKVNHLSKLASQALGEGKLTEDIEPKGGMAKIAAIVKNKQHGKVGGQIVDMQSANLLMKLYNAVKDKDKEKMNKMNEKKLIMVLNKLWSRVKLKLPV